MRILFAWRFVLRSIIMFGRRKKEPQDAVSGTSDRTLTDDYAPTKTQIKRATRTRLTWALVSAFLLLISIVFIILVEIGSTSKASIRANIYFIKLDLTNIVPTSIPNSVLINSIAQTLGLHDFYTVGLWSYCEGYMGEGFTQCSKPQTLWWFNPVEIIQSQLLSGASSVLRPARRQTKDS